MVVALLVFASPAWAGRYASIVIDADSGRVLHAANPDERSYPASLTKVMTLYLLFDELESGRVSLDTRYPVSAHASGQAPSKLGLQPGDRISVQDVILALVTKSANDAAVVAAEGIAGSEAAFAERMTQKARALGMSRTTYRNASGLPNPGQMSTVRDQATLARAMISRHAGYYRYFSTRAFAWKGQTITTHNRLMLRYPGADGIKTGYIHASGFNLISSAKRDGQRVIGVVFGGTTGASRDTHMGQLLDKGFARLHSGETVQVAAAPAASDDDDLPSLDGVVAAAQGGKAVAKAAAPARAAEKPAKAEKADKAKAPTKVAMRAPARRDDDDDSVGDADPDAWAIQIGAYKDYRPAQRAAAEAKRTLGRLAAEADIDIAKVGRKGHQVYRARLDGFNARQARAACKRLDRAGFDCRTVDPDA